MWVAQSCPTLCDPVDCNRPSSSVHGVLQARRFFSILYLAFQHLSAYWSDSVSSHAWWFFIVSAYLDARIPWVPNPITSLKVQRSKLLVPTLLTDKLRDPSNHETSLTIIFLIHKRGLIIPPLNVLWAYSVFSMKESFFLSHKISTLYFYFGCTGSLLQHSSSSLQHTGLVTVVCGILVPWLGVKPVSPVLEGRFLTTGPPGKTLKESCLENTKMLL